MQSWRDRLKSKSEPDLYRPPYGMGRTTGPPPVYAARKPLLPVSDDEARKWHWSDHALERIAERGIGVFEVLSALMAPEWSAPTGRGRIMKMIRGDIEVMADLERRMVITVTDRDSETRLVPREPLNPPVVVRGEPVTVHQPEAYTATEPRVVAPQETDSPIVEPQQKEEQEVSVTVEPPRVSASTAVRDWIASLDEGEQFTVGRITDEVISQTGATPSAIAQALATAVKRGEAVRTGGTRSGLYQRTIFVTESTLEKEEEPAVATVPQEQPVSDVAPERRIQPIVTHLFEFVDVLPAAAAKGIRAEALAHIIGVLDKLKENPGRWAKVEEMVSQPETARRHAKWVREQLADELYEVEARRLAMGVEKFGIYVRYGK